MPTVQLTCGIDGCGMTWSVKSAAKMKASVAAHRAEFHPGWVQPEPTPMTPYRVFSSHRP
jgi:hypothetical protein